MADRAILVVYRKQLGDLLLMQPAIEHLSRTFDAPVRVRTRPGFADLLALMPGQVALASSLRELPYRRVYCFDHKPSSLRDALAAWPARRILVRSRDEAAGWWRHLFHETLLADGRQDYRALLHYRALGGTDFRPPRLQAPPADWALPELPGRYLLVHPTSAWRRKTWPVESWVALLQKLLPQLDVPVVLTSGSDAWERQMAADIAAALPGRAIDIAGQTDMRAYLATLAGAAAVMTVDGSASHLAAAFGRPTLTLFGPTSPQHWHWPSARTPRLWAADFVGERKPPVAAIPVAAVEQAAQSWLAECWHG